MAKRPPIKFSVSISGDRKTQRAFDKLKKGAQGKVLRPALRAGAKVVKEAAQARAPKLSGAMARTMQVRSKRMSRKRVRVEHGGIKPIAIAARTAPRAKLNIEADDPYYYPAAVEFGTSKMEGRHFLEESGKASRGTALSTVRRTAKTKLREVIAKAKQGGR